MGVVTKTSLTCIRFGYLKFREQCLILLYLFIYFIREVNATVGKGLRNLRRIQGDLLTKH